MPEWSNSSAAGVSPRAAPKTWTKCGDIYSDEKSRSVFVCSACLERVDSFELGFQTTEASSFWTHVQRLHAGPAARHHKRKQSPGPPSPALATTAQQQTKKVKAEAVVVIEIDDAADRDSDCYSDNETNGSSGLNTSDKRQTAVGVNRNLSTVDTGTASEEVSSGFIMDCKVESEVVATQVVPSLAYESPIAVINLDEDEDTVMFAKTPIEPPLKSEHPQNETITAKHSDNDSSDHNTNNEAEESKASLRVSMERADDKRPDLNVKQEHFQQDLPTAAEDCEEQLQEIFGELSGDVDVDEATLNASSDGDELPDEDLFCFFKECNAADYQIGDLIELSDADDDDCDRNIYSPSLFSTTDGWASKQGYACTCPKCMETFSDSADFKEHLKIHMQEDLILQQQQQQPPSPTQRIEEEQQQQPQQRWQQPPIAMPQQQKQQQQRNVEYNTTDRIVNAEAPPSSPQRHQPMPPNDTRLTCSHCQRRFCHDWQLGRHLRIHGKPLQHEKTQTQKTQPQKTQPQKTQPQKTQPKTSRPFQCASCGIRTGTEDKMLVHIARFHSGSTNADTAKCDVCDKVLLKHSLPQHLLLHSAARCYKCQLCAYASKQKQSLNLHIKKQHADVLADRRRRKRGRRVNAAEAPPPPTTALAPAIAPAALHTPPAAAAAETAGPQLSPAEHQQLYAFYLNITEQMQRNTHNHRTSDAIPDTANLGQPHYPPHCPPLPPFPYGRVPPSYATYPTPPPFLPYRTLPQRILLNMNTFDYLTVY